MTTTYLPDCIVCMIPGEIYEFKYDFVENYRKILEEFIQESHEANKPIPFATNAVLALLEGKKNIYHILFNGKNYGVYRRDQKETIQKNGELREIISYTTIDGKVIQLDCVLHIDYQE